VDVEDNGLNIWRELKMIVSKFAWNYNTQESKHVGRPHA